eukprot:scaffold23798_cov13-Tisochrysis_lutea.AAC.1
MSTTARGMHYKYKAKSQCTACITVINLPRRSRNWDVDEQGHEVPACKDSHSRQGRRHASTTQCRHAYITKPKSSCYHAE